MAVVWLYTYKVCLFYVETIGITYKMFALELLILKDE